MYLRLTETVQLQIVMKADNFIISFCAECFEFQYKMQQSLVIKNVVQIMSYINFSIGNILWGKIELCKKWMKQKVIFYFVHLQTST